MPRNIDPGSLSTGSGKASPNYPDKPVLKDGSVVDGIGVLGYIPIPGALGDSRLGLPQPSCISGWGGTSGSSPAPTPTLTENELPPLPGIGQQFRNYPDFSGIPDWGPFKMKDQQFVATGDPTVPDPDLVFPLYWACPTPSQVADPIYRQDGTISVQPIGAFSSEGIDPVTDYLWNGPNNFGGGLMIGSGPAVGVAAGYTIGVGAGIQRTRTFPATGADWAVCVSGTVYPADHGVLALIHWPAGGDTIAFLAQTTLDRCIAAILLDSTNMFEPGADTLGYNPYAYPGRATGQYDLNEIHTGFSDIDGTPLPGTWSVEKSRHELPVTDQGAGQVRLEKGGWTYGIPILGGQPTAYTPAPLADSLMGSSLISTGNFFRYRLPVLDDYSATTGLKHTPRGVSPYTTREVARYFMVALPREPTSTDFFEEALSADEFLNWAGNYRNFPEDYWTWQIARYRHAFLVKGSDTAGDKPGTYWLIHFKTEDNFEAFVRDGIMPWAAAPNGYEVYGASAVAAIEDDWNRVNQNAVDVAPDYGYQADPYHLLRAEVVIGDDTTPPTPDPLNSWFTSAISATPQIMYCSGVGYFTPRDTAGDPNFWFTDLQADAAQVWLNSYRVDDSTLTAGVAPAVLSSGCPAFLGLAPFSYDENMAGAFSYTAPVGFSSSSHWQRQRIEFPFNFLGAYTEALGPVDADVMHLHLKPLGLLEFEGDYSTPAFSTDAVPIVYIRRPLTDPPVQPYDVNAGHGFRLIENNWPGFPKKVLFHSTQWDPINKLGQYGNFTNPLSVHGGGQAWSVLFGSTKDTEERFLDEVYRYDSHWSPFIGVSEQAQLVGPGMAGWIAAPIQVPVQAGYDPIGFWFRTSWTWGDRHLADLSADNELQVAGLPARNPPLDDWAQEPFPSSGILKYPTENYSTDYVPNLPFGGVVAQPDYSACAGEKLYIRCFDTTFTRSAWNAHSAGQPFVIVRVDGVPFSVFKYVAPGPGDPITHGVAILAKVPGLTTWMDLGRQDGSGPSKQDAALDGAGCLVVGPYSYEAIDPVTKLRYCQLRLNVGPVANFFPSGVDSEAPLLIKVWMNELAKTLNLVGAGPGDSNGVVEGLVGIKIVHPVYPSLLDASQVTGAVLIS